MNCSPIQYQYVDYVNPPTGITFIPYEVFMYVPRRQDYRVLLAPVKLTYKDKYLVEVCLEFKAGYMTDFGSVPPFLRGLVDSDSREMLVASLAHDYLYQSWFMEAGGKATKQGWHRANQVFLQLLQEAGMSKWKAWIAYLGVESAFGWDCYRERSEFDKLDAERVTVVFHGGQNGLFQ